ncbi:peptidase inhibitor family I36 protein [Kibdelosporangium lantanae]|uniref:Peptidase inhibitor family I36 protein n=1 Tax=Kibdelosporangium lantanae TaxID=1497396 RepID=A0ABW3M2J0_9PSEU
MNKLVQRGLVTTGLVITTALGTVAAAAADGSSKCDPGEFCLWAGDNYKGKAVRHTLETANPEQCIPLGGLEAHSLVNRMRKDVTVYQGETCSTEADFTTYPGGGTYAPSAPFVVRAIQVWN